MNVQIHNLIDWLADSSKTVSVPLFQRPYSWDQWQCFVMWNDIEKAIATDSQHFFGAIFYRNEMDRYGNPTISLIDGQQRMLTSFLLISALLDELTDHTLRAMAHSLLSPSSLQNGISNISSSMRVIPARKDEDDFALALSSDSANASQDGRACMNKRYFRDAIRASFLTPEQLWAGLNRFEIVVIELEPKDDAQRIFESFNSKGVPLVTADLVRNYLLLSKNPEMQMRLYEDYWEPIQGLFGDDPGSLRLNNAIRAWTVIRCKTPHAKSDTQAFEDFKQYFNHEFGGSTEELMEELLSFCSVWAENYRYHAIKKFRSRDWASLGRKTLVSDRKTVPVSRETKEYYSKHFGVRFKEQS